MEPTDNSPFYRVYDLAKARKEKTGHDPAPHQKRALDRLEQWYRRKQERGGILVLPTGGGKTFVATHFLCRHPLSDRHRILWLAHTHHLLEQAFAAFRKTMPLVREPAETARVRVVSGAVGHFRPAHIEADEDVLLCSLQTATRAFEKDHPRFIEFLDAARDGLFVVFDEAHHAPAPSYRRLLRGIRKRCPRSGLLGLTATPTYSNERKQGWLKQLFPQGIVAQEDAQTLMATGVLARPRMEDVRTEVKPEFDEREYQKGVALFRRGFFALFMGFFARGCVSPVAISGGHQAGQRVPASFRRPAEPRHGAEHRRSCPRQARSLLDIRAAFWYGAVGREADRRWL